jgi:hypothetical protein
VRFRIEQRFSSPLVDVEAALVDPAFIASLAALPKLGRPVLVGQQTDGSLVHQQVRYAFVGELSRAVKAVVDPARLTWIEDAYVDRDRHVTRFTIIPDHYQSLLSCAGTFELADSDSRGCRRRAEGEVVVTVPLVGRKVEAAIVSGLAEHANLEAQILDRWLQGGNPVT